ncbi:MAG: D-lysine 5,6-aminomutase subunit alpha [Thermodesulfobacteriota bacterium]|nr:MAG: D-lysine 5,6-aminomutase subunit alpha [Thermodesulfobacteriota bacterium]
MAHIPLNKKQVERVKHLAEEISDQVQAFVTRHSTISIERTVLRLYGVDGTDVEGIPLPNRIVDLWREKNNPANGISRSFASAMLVSGKDSRVTAELIAEGKITFGGSRGFSNRDIQKKEKELAETAVALLDDTRKRKEGKIKKNPLPEQPWRYLIVATGNVYDDRTQAKAAVFAGADIIAVIRSTVQSLIDYVPYGPTTEGVGGTFATQANFRIMRDALDEASEKSGRYVRLVNYSSGLCMAEIAACAAFEDLDILLNDSMYGILFRDINMKRTFIDQYFSRLICARAEIMINTGEDNYLTTSDAIDNAHTVTASQLINEAMAKKALLTDDLIGLGHAYEIDPEVENAFLYELAHAQLARQLFPGSPLKYMPPTKHKSTDIFLSHCMDTMFNLASITTGQGIHLAGILTEAIHNPLMQDRYQALGSINYVFHVARALGGEIEFKKDGFIAKRAEKVLEETEKFLEDILRIGLMNAIAQGKFADIGRQIDEGKGLDGVFEKGPEYSNPIMEIMEKEGR